MKVLFHVLTYFSHGGVTEDAFAFFRAMSRAPHIELESLFVERACETGFGDGKEPEPKLEPEPISIAWRLRVLILIPIKFVARCFVPRKHRRRVKEAIKRMLFYKQVDNAVEESETEAVSEEAPLRSVLGLSMKNIKIYLKRFKGRVDQAHLDQIMTRPCYYADRFVDCVDLAIDISQWDCLFLPFFIHPTNFSPKFLYLMRLHDICFVQGANYQMDGATDYLTKILDGAIAQENILFVCNSPYTQQQLEAYAPSTKGRNYLVPCQVPKYESVKQDRSAFIQGCLAHLSYRHLRPFNASKVRAHVEKLEDYLLVVGGEHARKNYENLLEGWLMYQERHPENALPIVWVGYECGEYMGSFIDDAKPLINKGKIIHLEKLPREFLNQLFMHAKAFIVASHDEGFSIPPVEAQQFRCPVIASDIQVHRWVLGEGALFFDGTKPQQLCDRLTQLLDPKAEMLRQQLSERGIENAERFYAAKIEQTFIEVLSEIEATQLPKFRAQKQAEALLTQEEEEPAQLVTSSS